MYHENPDNGAPNRQLRRRGVRMWLDRASRRWVRDNWAAASVQAARVSRRLPAAIYSKTVHFARSCHRLVREFKLWGILIALIGVTIAFITIMVELDDRQTERIFRAWQIALTVPSAGSSQREAVEYLNREFDGFVCRPWVNWTSRLLTGNSRRTCLIPRKDRESFARIAAVDADLAGADLRAASFFLADLAGADLSGADLTDADLQFTDLSGADLRGADLTNANLEGADLVGTLLMGLAEMPVGGSSAPLPALGRADMLDAPDPVCMEFRGDVPISRCGRHRRGRSFIWHSTNLTATDLTNANVMGATLTQAQLDAACGSSVPRNVPIGLKWNKDTTPCSH